MTTATNGHATAAEAGPLAAALAYLGAGLSVIPIRRDGSKSPDCSAWKDYQRDAAGEEQIRAWFAGDRAPGVAVIGGEVSGALECLDFDVEAATVFPAWCELVEAEAPGLLARLSIARTPKPGYHVRYRCPDVAIPGNEKLAETPTAEKTQAGKPKLAALIETRGEGGYALAPGCPAECHETGRLYEHHSGPPLEHVQAIGIEEREVLIRCARSFDRAPREEPPRVGKARAGLPPGTDFNRRGPDWPEILDGWTVARESGPVRYWRRPGKDGVGWSATTGVCHNQAGEELFYVFSSNADPFEPRQPYSKFAVYALLQHAGDFSAAARALAAQGYGDHQRSGAGQASAANSSTPAFDLGPLSVRLGPAHRTATRLVVPLAVFKAGTQVDSISLSKSAGGRKEAGRLLSFHLAESPPSAEDLNRFLSRIIMAAEAALDAAPQSTGPTVRDVVRAQVPQSLQFKYRSERGAWSQSLRCELPRAEFLAFTPGSLVEAAALAVDAPGSRPALLDAVRCEMQVLWADLMATLPPPSAAGLTAESPAAVAFRQIVRDAWSALCTNRRIAVDDGPPMVVGGTLLSAVAEEVRKPGEIYAKHHGRPPWVTIHYGYNAWCRPGLIEATGEIVIRLAMRYELLRQTKASMPNVPDHRGFAALGKALGVFDPHPNVPVRTSAGSDRLSVLVVDFSQEMLDNPATWEPPEQEAT